MPPGYLVTTTMSARSPATARRSPGWTSRIRRLRTPSFMAPLPMWLCDGVGLAPPPCWSWLYRAVPTFTKAKNLASQRSKIFPKKPSKTPPGNVLDTQIAVVTDVAFPCRGAVPTHPMGGRQTRTPGSPCRVIGPSGPSNLSRTIRHPSLPSSAPYWPSAMPTQHWAPER